MRFVGLGSCIFVAGFFASVLGCSSEPSGTDAGGAAGAGSEEGSGGQGSGGTGSASRCEEGCELTLEADCENGPGSQAECVADCEELLAGECGSEYEALQTCSEGEPVECGDSGIPVVSACADEQDTFIACLNAP